MLYHDPLVGSTALQLESIVPPSLCEKLTQLSSCWFIELVQTAPGVTRVVQGLQKLDAAELGNLVLIGAQVASLRLNSTVQPPTVIL